MANRSKYKNPNEDKPHIYHMGGRWRRIVGAESKFSHDDAARDFVRHLNLQEEAHNRERNHSINHPA